MRFINWLKRLFGFGYVQNKVPESTQADKTEGESTPIDSPSVESGVKLKVKILDTSGFTASDLEKIKRAEEIVYQVVNSDLYKEEFLKANFTETKGKTNQEILNELLSGDCQFTDADGVMDIKLVMYYKRYSSVVGYFDGTPLTIFMNRKFFSTPLSIASNLWHEYIHIVGYSHYEVFETSVPYLAGNTIFESVANKLNLT